MADEHKMTISQAVNEMTRVANTYRAAEHLKEALAVVSDMEGQKAALKKEIEGLQMEAKAANNMLFDLRETVELARSQTKSDLAKLDNEIKAKRKLLDDSIATMDKEYEQAQQKAKERLAQTLGEHQVEIDQTRAKLGEVQRQFHRLEAQMLVMEQKNKAAHI